MLISVEGTGKNQLETRQESMGDAQVLPHYSLLKEILDRNRPVFWSIVAKKKQSWLSIFLGVSFDRVPKAMNDVNVLSLFTVLLSGMNSWWTIPWQSKFYVNYTSEFGELFFYLLHISIIFHLIHPSFMWFSFFPCSFQCSRWSFFCGIRWFCILSTRPFCLSRREFINFTISVLCNISLISLFFFSRSFFFFYGSIYFPYNIPFKYYEHFRFFRGLCPECCFQRLLLRCQSDVGIQNHSRPTIVKVKNEWSSISIKPCALISCKKATSLPSIYRNELLSVLFVLSIPAPPPEPHSFIVLSCSYRFHPILITLQNLLL